MKLVNKSLPDTLRDLCASKPEQLPFDHASRSYIERFSEMAAKLDRDFHSNVQAGSAAADGGMLTDHGPNHIRTVIQRAGAILDNPNNQYGLTAYEIYLLLCAIHFHDLGNISGREKHEARIEEMMEHVKNYLGDSAEQLMIKNIASVHGGRVDGSKDTISYLLTNEPLNGLDVRPRMLAAILRFSDELADDHYRANNILQKLGAIPKQSVIYHKYASCLHSVIPRDDCQSIALSYTISADDLIKKFPKFNPKTKRYREIFIVDEILSRLHKMYCERTYCNRFMNPVVNIQSLSVHIKAVRAGQAIGERLPEISFRLEDTGYPDSDVKEIYTLSDDLETWGARKRPFSGAEFADAVKKMLEAA